MPYTKSLSGVSLPNTLIDEVDAFAQANGFDRSEAARRLLMAGLDKAAKLKPSKPKPHEDKPAAEEKQWIQAAADRAEDRSKRTRITK
jgi:hypothetical protein